MGEEPSTNFEYPIEITRLSATDEHNGLTYLADYLTLVRNNLITQKKNSDPDDGVEGYCNIIK